MTPQLKIEYVPINSLNEAVYNPRIIDKKEFAGLVASIKTFGLVDPIIINGDNTIIGGHQRRRAALTAGYDEVPCIRLHLDKHTEAKLNTVLNSQEISGKYDEVKLAELLEDFKLDDDYETLRLDELEPLDLSEKQEEKETERNNYVHVWHGDNDDANYLRETINQVLEDNKIKPRGHYDYAIAQVNVVEVWHISGGRVSMNVTPQELWLEFSFTAESDSHPFIDALFDAYTGRLDDVDNIIHHIIDDKE